MPGLLSSLRAAGIDGTTGVVGIRRGLRPVTGFGDVEVSDSDGGLNVGRNPGIGPAVAMGPAKIVTTGPDDEDDYTDCRYWLTWLRAKQVNGDKVELTESGTHSDVQIFTATSLADEADDTHALQPGARVFVFAQEDENGADRLVFLPALPPDVTAVASVDSNADGGGDYLGTIYTGQSTADGTADLAMPEGMTAGDPALILHLPEDGQPTHWLETGSYVEGKVVGRLPAGADPEADPARWVLVVGNGTCRTDGNTLAGGSGTTAQTDTWDRTRLTSGTDYGDGSITETYQTRTVWDGTAKKLYQYTRTRVFDAGGKLVSISAETRTEIDAVGSC
jgi:hypothetical protein